MRIKKLIEYLSSFDDDTIVCIHSNHTAENLILTESDLDWGFGVIDGEEIVEYDEENKPENHIEFVKFNTYH